MKMKVCLGCLRSLPTDNYYRHSATSDGLRTRCKACLKAEAKQHYEKIRGVKLAARRT